MTDARARELVLNALAYAQPRSSADVVGRLQRASVRLDADLVDVILRELVDAELVEPVGSRWRRR